MTTSEISKTIERLKSAFNFHRFNEDGVTEEYQRFLSRHNFQQINSAIDNLIESDSQRVPPISAIIKTLKESNKPGAVEVRNPEYCAICDNKGFILMTEIESNLDDKPYQYVLHCTCLVGKSLTYDGKNCKKGEQSPYIIPCITEYFDDYAIDQMKKANRQKYKMTSSDRQAIKDQLGKFGIRMPDLKPHEVEKGDAWESDEPCPF
jgi:hypothetical protein